MPKKKAPGAAGARRQTQYLVTKEGQLAKRLIARPRRLSADAPAGKKRPGVKH